MNVADGARAGRPGGEEGRLARRSAFNFVGLGAANAFQFGMVWVLARRLGQHDAGVFFEGFAAIRLLSVVASLGLDVTAVRYVAVHRAQGDHGAPAPPSGCRWRSAPGFRCWRPRSRSRWPRRWRAPSAAAT